MSFEAPHTRTERDHSDACSVLHNMSSPPRSKITLRPLKIQDGAWNTDPDVKIHPLRNQSRSGGGLEWVMRVDLDRLIQSVLPDFDGRSGCGTWGDTSQEHPQLRLRCCVVIARSINRTTSPMARDDVDALRDTPFEVLCDELRELNAVIDPTPLKLPAMGMMIQADTTDRSRELNAARVLYVLSRLHGTTFVCGASSMVAGRLHGNICQDLWLPI